MSRNSLMDIFLHELIPEMGNTIWMLVVATIIALILGGIFALAMICFGKGGLHPCRPVFIVLESLMDVLISMPFIILAITILPLTRVIVGTSIGKMAALVPLTIVTTAVLAKYIYNGLLDVNPLVVKAAQSFGASDIQIMYMIVREALPMIISGVSISTVTTLGSISMMGALGAGGIGYVAIAHGYRHNNSSVIFLATVLLIIMTQVIQSLGDKLHRRFQ